MGSMRLPVPRQDFDLEPESIGTELDVNKMDSYSIVIVSRIATVKKG